MNFLNPLPQRIAKRKQRIMLELCGAAAILLISLAIMGWWLPPALSTEQQQLLRRGLPVVSIPPAHSIEPSFLLLQQLSGQLSSDFPSSNSRLFSAKIEQSQAELLLVLSSAEQALLINQWQLAPWQVYRYALEHEPNQLLARIELRLQP